MRDRGVIKKGGERNASDHIADEGRGEKVGDIGGHKASG
jgi:hypothetical protein